MDQSEVLKFEQTKTLRLSEAIRIGARIRPQGKIFMFINGASCAWGAAYEGRGGAYQERASFAPTMTARGAVISSHEFHEVEAAYEAAYGIPMWSDNDSGMPREEIADRLEKIGY